DVTAMVALDDHTVLATLRDGTFVAVTSTGARSYDRLTTQAWTAAWRSRRGVIYATTATTFYALDLVNHRSTTLAPPLSFGAQAMTLIASMDGSPDEPL